MRALPILFAALLFTATPAFAQSEPETSQSENPIDQALSACLYKAIGEPDMVLCLITARRAWEKELDQVYAAMRQKVKADPESLANLEKSQELWLAYKASDADYRTHEFAFPSSGGNRNDQRIYGSMIRVIEQQVAVDTVRQRLELLQTYLDPPT